MMTTFKQTPGSNLKNKNDRGMCLGLPHIDYGPGLEYAEYSVTLDRESKYYCFAVLVETFGGRTRKTPPKRGPGSARKARPEVIS